MSNELLFTILENAILLFTTIKVAKTTSAVILNKRQLNKISKYNGYVIKEFPFIDNESIENRKKELNKTSSKDLLSLFQKLANYTSEENLKTVYRNILTLKVKKNKSKLFFNGYSGTYDSKLNEIEYSDKIYLGHEFLHLASSYYDFENDEVYSGFEQSNNKFTIGTGLNEGYTELLASRIFNINNRIQSYKQLVQIARLFELFFDDPKDMEKLYFNSNLYGFVKYMNKYADTKSIIKLLLEMDSICTHLSLNPSNPYILYKSIKIQYKLYKWFIANTKDKEKIKQFENIISENKIMLLLLNKCKMKLYKNSPYEQKDNIENNKNKTYKR